MQARDSSGTKARATKQLESIIDSRNESEIGSTDREIKREQDKNETVPQTHSASTVPAAPLTYLFQWTKWPAAAASALFATPHSSNIFFVIFLQAFL